MNKSGYRDPTAETAISNVDRERRRLIKPMDLFDTIELMSSGDYNNRFKAEYYQLKIRYERLKAIVEHWDSLNFQPTCDRKLLRSQLDAMQAYLQVLKRRAKIEGIRLGEAE